MFKKCQGRIFAIFECCHAGTMYRVEAPGTEVEQENEEDSISLDGMPFGFNWIPDTESEPEP